MAAAVLAAAFLADRYWNFGLYTDGALRLLTEIRGSFGW
jgi:hypothetical protein